MRCTSVSLTAFTLAKKSGPARHGTARHRFFCQCKRVACRAVPCRAVLADTLSESVLTRHGTAPLFCQCKRKRAKVGRAGAKKLLSWNFEAYAFCLESDGSRLERRGGIQASRNIGRSRNSGATRRMYAQQTGLRENSARNGGIRIG